MQSTHLEFEIFEDIINGDLEPIKLFNDRLTMVYTYLKEQHDQCQVTTFTKFSTRTQEPAKDQIILPHLHPLSCEYINQTTIQGICSLTGTIHEEINKINKDRSSQDIILIKQKNHHLIGVMHQKEWEQLDPYLVKFCYYHLMLTSYVKNLKRSLFNELYKLDDQCVKRRVNRTHTRLINFCDQVIHKYDLSTSDLKLKIKTSYTDKDCMAIVYLHLNDLINFLVNDYFYYLHAEAHVPYNAEILRRYQLQETARKTIKIIKAASIDQDLKKIIEHTIKKVLNLDTRNRITYYEITYYSHLINELHYFLLNCKKVNDNSLTDRLIELGFNHYVFIKYVTDSIEKEADQVSTEVYLSQLIERRKEWEQCILSENRIFNKDLESAHTALTNWINSEIEFNQYKLEENSSKDEKEKLEIDLSVSQLALMTRLFHEVTMNSNTSISQVASYVVDNYKTQNSASISLKSFKNNLYKLEDSTISEVKSKLIEMVNRANDL